MDILTLQRKICHKVAQLQRAEQRVADCNNTFNYNNYLSTQRALHLLAEQLMEATK